MEVSNEHGRGLDIEYALAAGLELFQRGTVESQ